MKQIYGKLLFMLTLLLSAAGFTANAEDYPDFYLRGTQNSWGCENEYKFTRAGARYYLHLTNFSKEFKIGNPDWTINYGGSRKLDASAHNIKSFGEVVGEPDGRNWKYEIDSSKEITITFVYNKLAPEDNTTVSFLEGYLTFPDEPDPNPNDPTRHISGTLPVLYINVYTDETHSRLDNEIIDKNLAHKNYFSNSEYWLDLNGCEWMKDLGAKSVGSADEPLPLEIKARGNYTRTGFSKKPFKLKLGKKQNLLGLTPEKSKHYAILAHADDTFGYLRNFTGFNLGKRIELPWTPGMQPIEVIINGDYRGLYFLTESIRVGDGRIMIEDLKDNESEPALVSGGYLVELDNYDEDNQIQFYEKPYANGDPMVRVTFDTPEEYSSIQRQFISDQFNAINDNIGNNSNKVWSYLDLDDAARYYIVEELIGHTESYHGSTYLFRDRGEGQKWHFSPLWDCGNAFRAGENQHFFGGITFGNTWIHTLIKNNKFQDKVCETWKWFMSIKFDGIYDDMNQYCQRLEAAAKADYKRWSNAPRPDSGNASSVADNRDIMNKYQQVNDYLKKRVNWMKELYGNYDMIHSEPARDTTPAAPLPEYITVGVDEIENAVNSAAEYYTIDGLKVSNPESGLYIRVINGESQKVIVK